MHTRQPLTTAVLHRHEQYFAPGLESFQTADIGAFSLEVNTTDQDGFHSAIRMPPTATWFAIANSQDNDLQTSITFHDSRVAQHPENTSYHTSIQYSTTEPSDGRVIIQTPTSNSVDEMTQYDFHLGVTQPSFISNQSQATHGIVDSNASPPTSLGYLLSGVGSQFLESINSYATGGRLVIE